MFGSLFELFHSSLVVIHDILENIESGEFLRLTHLRKVYILATERKLLLLVLWSLRDSHQGNLYVCRSLTICETPT